MKYAFSAILYPDDEHVGVTVPDLPGCHTFGENTADALFMAKDAIEAWLYIAENKGWEIPTPSADLKTEPSETVSFVAVDTDEYRRVTDSRAVKKTLTLPSWLNARAEEAHINFSQTLQKALKEELQIAN